MADMQSNIQVNIDTTGATASLKNLQRQISAFHTSMAKSGAAAGAVSSNLQQNLINSINRGGQFAASMKTVKSSAESFTTALEKNKLSMGQYFKYAGASTKTFGRLFTSEFNTIEKVARERVKSLQTQYIKLGRDANGAIKAISVRPLTLDMQSLATQTAINSQKQQLFNQLMKQGSTNLLNFGKNTQWAGRQLMVGFTIPLAYLGTTAAKTFMEMEKQAVRFKRVYGEIFTTSAETDKMAEEIKNLGKEFTKYGVAVADTMKLAADAAAMGKMGADLTAQVAEATRLAVLGGVEQAEALETTISLTNAFGVSAENLAGKIDFLNAVENQTVTSIEDLTVAVPKAGPVIQQLGGDVEDLAFFLTAMKEGGINASEGANALKSGLASMINPAGKAAEFLQSFGINLKGIVEANKGDVKGTVVEFAKALDTLDPLNRAQAIEQLFGKFQFSRLSTLFQNVIADGSQASKVLKLTQATTEELAILSERELKRVEDSPMFKFQKAIEDIKVSLVPLGEAFLKAVTPVVEFGSQILEKFNKLDEGAKNFIVGVTAVLGAIGPIAIMSFGLLANGVANIIKGFLFVKNVFTGAGKSSKELGSQLSYMSSEQLEAAAVAASLDQVHNRLIQTFSSEASAISRLTAAYSKAIAAQSAFSLSNASRGPRAKMANGGMVRGPGGPKDDLVPTDLSNGEAVIDAETVRKNPRIIAALFSGKKINIPGYAGNNSAQFAHVNENATVVSAGSMLDSINAAEAAGKVVSKKLKDLLVGIVTDIGRDFRVRAYSGLGFSQSGDLNRRMRGNAPVPTGEFLSDFQARGTAKWNKAVKMGGGNLKDAEVQLHLEQYDSAIIKGTKAWTKLSGSTTITSDQFAKIELEARKTLPEFSQLRMALDSAEKGLFEVRANLSQNALNAAGVKTTRLPSSTGSGLSDKATGRFSTGTYVRSGGNRAYKTSAGAIGGILLHDIKDAIVGGAKAATKQASPSKAARDAGKNIGIGAIQGIESGVAGAKVAGAKIAAATQSGANEAALVAAGKNARKMGRNEQGPLLPGQKRQRSLPKISMKGAGGAGMAASGVLMAASMAPGKVGEIAQQAMMPVMALTAILPLLSSGIGLIVVALGALAAAVVAMKMQFDAAQESAIKMAESMGTGSKAMEGYAKFAGNVTASEVMDKRRANSMSMFQIQNGKTTFGQSYVQGEEGKQKIQDVRNSMKTAGRGATVSGMVNQMATAVSSGALDPAQARSIVANLASEMGDMSFGMQVTAQLNDIIGPNGENLAKDPLKVRMDLMENTRNTMNKSSEALNSTMGMTGKDGLQLGGGIAAGAGAGAAVGAIAGSIIPIVGTAVGAVAGTIVGAIGGGIVGSIERSNRIAAASGAMVGLQKEALQQQQQMVDSLDLTYQKKIEEAKAAGDVAEAERLTNEYIAARPKLLEAQGRLNADIQASYEGADAGFAGGLFSAFGGGGARAAMNSGADKAIDTTFKGTANEDMANVVKDQIKGASLTDAQDYNLRIAFSTGDIDPLLLSGFLGQFGSNAEVMNKTMNIVTTMGGAFAADTMQVMNMFVDKDGKPMVQQQTDFIANMSAKTPEEASKYLDLFLDVKNIGQVADLGLVMSFYLENPAAQKAMQDAQKMIDEHKGKMDMDFVANVVGAENVDAVVRAGTEFTNLDAEQQKVFVSTMKTMLLMEGDPAMKTAYQAWLAENGFSEKDKPFDDYVATKSIQVTQAATDVSKDPKAAEKKPTGSGGVQSSVLDNLTQKLKELRNIQVKVTEGWAASGKELMKWLGGNKDIKVFSGLKQQMRALGAGEDLISLIAGMDPKEYEKKKNQLFEFDKKGNIIKLKALAQATGKALKEIALGEFQSQQQQVVVDVKNQTTALNRLIGAGIGVADAYSIVEDAALAASIASKKLTDAELKKIVKTTKEAIAAMKLYTAAQTVKKGNEETADRSKVIAKLAASNYTDAQRKAILDSADLQKLYLSKTLSQADFTAFQTALANAVNATQLEIDGNKLTTEGIEQNFQNAMSKAMERIEANETAINIKFEAEMAPNKEIVETAQEKIADYNYEIDNLDASLRPIEEAEKRINEQYDARTKALDEVASINDTISRQQKQQLSVAEAITRGDISAAATAAQDARAAEAAAAIESQKKALEKNRDLTLAGLVNAQGLTRAQVEEKIKDLKDKIFEIEENTLEPAQRAIELSERRRDAELETWENLKKQLQATQSLVDIAKTSQPAYTGAAGDVTTIGNDLVDSYNNGNVNDGATDNGPKAACPPDLTTKGTDPKMTYTWNTSTCTWDVKKKVATSTTSTSSSSSDSGVVQAKRPTGDAGYGKKWVYDKASNKWNATTVNQPSGTPYANAVWIWDTQGDKWDLKAPKPTKAAPGGGTWVYNASSNAWDVKPPSMTQGVKKDDLFTTMGKGIANFAAGLFGFSSGGMVPRYFDKGGIAAAFSNTFANNTDTIPAMLTPGEFVVKKSSVDSIGYKNLQRINDTGMLGSNSVYNYDVSINVKSEANVNDISRAVITEIKRIDSQRIRGNRL